MHPFTCGGTTGDGRDCRHDLVATEDGWVCPACAYTQNWAHDFMADFSWKATYDAMRLPWKTD